MMAVTLDDFCSYLFLPLLLLGMWCLFEGGNNFCTELLVMLTVKLEMSVGVFF